MYVKCCSIDQWHYSGRFIVGLPQFLSTKIPRSFIAYVPPIKAFRLCSHIIFLDELLQHFRNYKRYQNLWFIFISSDSIDLTNLYCYSVSFRTIENFSWSKIPGKIITDSHDQRAAEGRKINNSTIYNIYDISKGTSIWFLFDRASSVRLSNTDEPTRCNNDLLIHKISLTCFGQSFAHHQERETLLPRT